MVDVYAHNKDIDKSINYGDTIYSKTFYSFNGVEYCPSAKISIVADPDGVIRSSKTYNNKFKGAVPGKIQFSTASDNGILRVVGEFDKSGKLIVWDQLWSVTQNPSGIPLMLISNTNEPGAGASLNMRRSRGTYYNPTSVKLGDPLFKISWYAHDGKSYNEAISINSYVTDDVGIGIIPTELSFKFLSQDSKKVDVLKISSNSEIFLDNLKSLKASEIKFNSPITLLSFLFNSDRDLNLLNPKLGTLIYSNELDTVQVFTKRGWINLC